MSRLSRYCTLPASERLPAGRYFLSLFRVARMDTLTIARKHGCHEAEVVKLMHLAREHERASRHELVSA